MLGVFTGGLTTDPVGSHLVVQEGSWAAKEAG